MAKKFEPTGKYLEWLEHLEDLEPDTKTHCYRCRKKGHDNSGDNFHWYGEEQGGSCFKCDFFVPSKEVLDEIGYEEDIEGELEMSEDFDPVEWRQYFKQLSATGRGYRGICDEVNKRYLVRYEYDPESGKLEKQHCTITTDLKVSGVKTRKMPKKFVSMGDVGRDADLFGQFTWKDSNSKVAVITAGEVDCLSASTILENYRKERHANKGYDPVPVLSPTVGETAAYKQIQAQYEYLKRFDKIIICFDNDSAGEDALHKISQVLPREKMWVMRLSLKDTNSYIWDKKAGKAMDRSKEWMNAYWNAEKYVPSGVVASTSVSSAIREALAMPRLGLPEFMKELEDLMAGGIPLGTIINLGSASGTGKSTIVNEMIYHWIFNSPYMMGILTLEADKAQYGIDLLSRHLGRKVNRIKDMQARLDFINSEEAMAKEAELFADDTGNPRFYLMEDRGSQVSELQDLVEKMIIELECKVIVIDPLQDLMAGLNLEAQEEFLDWQKVMIKSHQVIFININHVRKNGGGNQANSTGAELYEEDFQGSSSIFKSGACNLLFMRDKESECIIEKNTTYMKATKIRWTGETAHSAGEYFYDNESHTIRDRKKIPGMPIGRLPKPDKDGNIDDTRPRVGRNGEPQERGAPPQQV